MKGRIAMLITRLIAFIILLIFSLSLNVPLGLAVDYELTTNGKKTLDEIIKSASPAIAERMRSQYDEFLATQRTQERTVTENKQSRVKNAENEAKLRQDIRNVDQAVIQKYEQQVQQAKSRYHPIFDQYSQLNQQLALARKLKDKELTAMLRSQADIMKITVQIARQDLRNKQDDLSKARSNRTSKIKKLRNSLERIDTWENKMKIERHTMSQVKQRQAFSWKNFQEQIKNKNTAEASTTLSSLNLVAKQLLEHHREVGRLESRIAQHLVEVRKQLTK
jgi:hypothetical protein